ncbi:VOC family protein [Microbacterium fluvii]|uniref:VOC family protein n=1 Tax=Microbacterium fluvii TaxID=415215 RepID=A0ABW2HCP0_9MICO|nr:VOC family protein [Microbacterium fluvii]MCU4671826.1 VOC family protein [Microbacterium fluvii]
MPLFDHLGVSVDDVARAIAQYDPILTALGLERTDADDGASWYADGETEFIVRQAREPHAGPHRHGHIGWQHLAFAVGSRDEVDRLHTIAVDAGWAVIRAPKLYPRFNDHYYASFVEDDNGIRIEFMHNPGSD